jgi:two-component system, chemotaxis family, chemotaxis protein CheY
MYRVEFSRLRFLVVDDNSYLRRLVRTLLHGFGSRDVLEAEDGAAALDGFANGYPDIILTDWEMPILTGIELTKLIRTSENSVNPFVPIIMLSAYADRQMVMMARDAGVNEFLVKPLSARALHQRIVSVVLNPRSFIKTASYFGPDRRRVGLADFDGPEKRKGYGAQISSPHKIGIYAGDN